MNLIPQLSALQLSAFEAAGLLALTVLVALVGGYHLVNALRAREQLVAHAEDLAADPSVLSDPLRRKSFLVRWADRYNRSPAAEEIRERLRRAHLRIKPSDYRVFHVGGAIGLIYICVILLHLPLLPSALLGLAAYLFVPSIIFRIRRDAYVNAFNNQLIEIAQLLSNALKAGMSIQQALAQVIDRLEEPARGEFRQTNHELLLGDNLALALNGLRQRVRSRDLDVMVNAIIVQHQAGGNLARVLSAMANILTERRRLMSEIRSLTAEARFSAIVVQLMPIALLVLIRGTPIGEALFGTLIGWIILVIYGLIQVGVFFLIRRIARIEV